MKNVIKCFIWIIKYFIISIIYFFNKPKVKILNDKETLNYIFDGYSISRFGDGEIRWLLNSKITPAFQERDMKLSKDLKNVFQSQDDKLLVCLPENIINMNNKTLESKFFWKKFVIDYWNEFKLYVDDKRVYGNTNLTRFYMDYKNKKVSVSKIEEIKEIWNEKNILIVEGCQTRLGVGNDLFEKAKTIKRILCPAENAYKVIDDIYIEITKNIRNIDIVLIALGPTATVLAHKLLQEKIQVLDIGHIDIEYEWFKNGAKRKSKIEGKYVNELGGIFGNIELNDKKYQSEIFTKVDGGTK